MSSDGSFERATAQRAQAIAAGLRELYPDADCELRWSSPFELLVATVLSAQSTDKKVNEVTVGLFRRYPSPRALAEAERDELEELLRPTGFYRQKAKNVQALSRRLIEEHEGEVPRAMEDLVDLPGVARKTANVVLGTAFGVASGFVVDTHVKRLGYRLGLTEETDPVKIERDLMALFDRESWIFLGHAVIWHGRRVCSARKPECASCALLSCCPRNGLEPL